eukprot:m.58276 g.58276  ORF g.58276 m.58276 type:complete len:140 (+) comp18985_c0_seq1:98-517(+)
MIYSRFVNNVRLMAKSGIWKQPAWLQAAYDAPPPTHGSYGAPVKKAMFENDVLQRLYIRKFGAKRIQKLPNELPNLYTPYLLQIVDTWTQCEPSSSEDRNKMYESAALTVLEKIDEQVSKEEKEEQEHPLSFYWNREGS